jgi:hypothetical protein
MYKDVSLDNDRTMGDASPLRTYQFLVSFPADPQKGLEETRAFYAEKWPKKSSTTQTQYDSQLLKQLATAFPADPRGLSRVYRLMARERGLTTERTVDVLGREAIAVYPAKDDPRSLERAEMLFDAKTYAYTGVRMVAAKNAPDKSKKDPDPSAETWRKGELRFSETVTHALVGHKNQRP